MRSVRHYLWKLIHQGTLALLMLSLLFGFGRLTRTVGSAFSTTRAPLPVFPVGATEEEEQEREETQSVNASMGSSPRRPGRTVSAGRLAYPHHLASLRLLAGHCQLSHSLAALPGTLGSGVCLRC